MAPAGSIVVPQLPTPANLVLPKLGTPTNDEFFIFGKAVAVLGDIALVGAPDGYAFSYLRSGTTWSFSEAPEPSDGFIHDCFGWSVAFSGTTALVGASGSRKVYVYTLK